MLTEKRIFLFDIDGTLAVDKTLYRGTKDMLHYIDSIGGHAFYITNNSTKSRTDYCLKFKEWGIAAAAEQFVTASYATALYLKEQYGRQKLFALGTRSFIEELRGQGLRITEEAEADVACVVVGFDLELNYSKAAKACELLFRPEVEYVATNPDYRCPAEFGFIPDCGAICEMLRVTTDRLPHYVGKPNAQIAAMCLAAADGGKEESLVVGDRLYTDIACGINSGIETALVLTGEAKRADLEQTAYPPDYVFETIYDLYRAVSGNEN